MSNVFNLKIRKLYFPFKESLNLMNLLHMQNICVCAFSLKRFLSFHHFLRRVCDPPKSEELPNHSIICKKSICSSLKSNTQDQRASHLPSRIKKKNMVRQASTGEKAKEEKCSRSMVLEKTLSQKCPEPKLFYSQIFLDCIERKISHLKLQRQPTSRNNGGLVFVAACFYFKILL